MLRGPRYRLRYAQHTKIHSNALDRGLDSPKFLSAAGKKRLGWELDSVGEGNVMADSREVMNIRQASQYLGVSPDTLYKYVNEQKIPAFKLGNRWRFKKSKLDQWMEEKSMELDPRGKKKIKAAVKAAGTP
jgi:excisionase family DNA binding protein